MKSVDPSEVYRLLYPSVPAVVAAEHSEKLSAMPVVSVISVSDDPALVGFSASPSHDTYRTASRARRFSLSWLGEEHRQAVETLGTTSGRSVTDKLASCGLGHRKEGVPAVPVVAGAVAYVVCGVVEERKYGDHVFVVGKVEQARASSDFNGYWSFRDYRPILYAGIAGPKLRLSLSKAS